MITHATIKLITYDCGVEFDTKKFKPIINRKWHNKPFGGLWGSPVDSVFGWKDWNEHENYAPLAESFKCVFGGLCVIINTFNDLNDLTWKKKPSSIKPHFIHQFPDFEFMKKNKVDGVWLTVKGAERTRVSHPNLYGWDCESVLVLNPESVTQAK